MRTGADRLRVWLVACSVGLLLAVGGFLGYARHRERVFLAGLPGKLGVNITRETDGYTYSQTVEGRTIFTLHAAKLEQQANGLVKLHDVGVVVYGRQQNRADRIYGKEFEFDQAAGIVRALGLVNLDLQAPAPAEGKKQTAVSATGAPLSSTDARVIHVTTSGLVYLTKLGVAATGEDVDFSTGSMSGRAHGADFNADTGIVVLQSAVRVNGLTASGPAVLTANRAELDRNSQVTNLTGAKLVTTAETVDAQQAVVYVRKDGSPERVEGSGRVTVARAEGGVLTAERAELALNEANKPTAAKFLGSVRFVEDDAGRHAEGNAARADVRFDAAGLAEHVVMSGGVAMAERESGSAVKGGSRRTLAGSVVEVALGPATGRKREMRGASAVGGARLVVMNEAPIGGKAGATTTDLAGDEMMARFGAGQRVSNLLASGHTVLHQVNAAGVEERSAGDRTEMVFRPGETGLNGIESAVQTGQVEMVRKAVKAAGGKPMVAEQRGTAQRAAFDGPGDQVTLTGDVVLADAQSTIRGAKVVVNRTTGDAVAEGGVQVSYLQPGETGKHPEPMHVLADHATLRRGAGKGSDRAFFFGVVGRAARMWQGGSQVEAPVLEFDQGAKRLTATGQGSGTQVHAVLVPAAPPGGKAAAGKANQSGPVRVTSREMVYSDAAREVVFSGGVLVEDAGATMRSERATAYLQGKRTLDPAVADSGAADKAAADATGFLGGNVERIVAEGKVALDQPGRRGVGEHLVYTAADGLFVLTGTPGAPPRMEDEARGTVTGATLRFHRGDDSVVVTGSGIEQGAGTSLARKPVRTETRVKQQ